MDSFIPENVVQMLQEFATGYGLKLLGALAIFIIGRWVARALRNFLRRFMTARQIEGTLVGFTVNLTYAALVTFVAIAALNNLGVQTTSFVAILGAAGLAVGLALQGSLANFAAGVLLIIFRPFKVGDFVEAGGVMGTVEELQIFTTQMRTPDNKTIIIPNGKITAGSLTNFSAKETRRVDMQFGVSYGDDIRRVKEVIWEVLKTEERILEDPAPTVALLELGDSSINFVVRPWVKTGDYWDVYFNLNEQMKLRFDEEGISIPFPQRDVHLYSVPGGEAAAG